MRGIILILVFLFLNAISLGQQGKRNDPDQAGKLETPINKQQLLELPRRDRAPQITLKQALKIAENLIKKEKIDVSCCYLFEAKWSSAKGDAQPSWRFWWVSLHRKSTSAMDLRIIVSDDGKPKLSREETVVSFVLPVPNLR